MGEWDAVVQKGQRGTGMVARRQGGERAVGWHGGGERDVQESGPLRVTHSRVAWRGRVTRGVVARRMVSGHMAG